MKCQRCGAEILEGLSFCYLCNEQIELPPPAPKKRNIWWIICSTVLALALVAGGLFVVFHDSDEWRSQEEIDTGISVQLLKHYVKYSLNGELDKILDLMPDEEVAASADEAKMTVQKMREYLAKTGAAQKEAMDKKFGEGWTYEYTFLTSSSVGIQDGKIVWPMMIECKRVSDSKFNELKEQYDTLGLELEDARIVRAQIEIEGAEAGYATKGVTVYVVKFDGQWYLSGLEN